MNKPTIKEPKTARSQVMGSVIKTFEVLEIFGDTSKPMSFSELERITEYPKGSLHRILSTLVHGGFIKQSRKSAKYSLTLKAWSIGMVALTGLDILEVSRPQLTTLCQAADETVHLAMLESNIGIVYLAKVESPRSIRVQTRVGQVAPSWCTATGRALLAFKPEIIRQVLSLSLPQLTPKTVTSPEKLKQILDEIARTGFSVSKAEYNPEMGGIAAPVRDYSGAVIASCGVAIPIFRMDEELINRCVPLVVDTAAKISSDMGFVE